VTALIKICFFQKPNDTIPVFLNGTKIACPTLELHAQILRFWDMQKKYDFDWGSFVLSEFLVSERANIKTKYKTALDIGSGDGIQAQVMRHAGLKVSELDKYNKNTEYQVDFISYNFDRKFDVIFCSHVIEHQRNVGLFLDKIYDLLSENGVLLISAPKHKAELLIEGHLNCFFTTYFIQHLTHAGFDIENGKYMSCGPIENSAIVKKAQNFDLTEREEAGYQWTPKHQERSFLLLRNQEISNNMLFFHNCEFVQATEDNSIGFRELEGYEPHGIVLGSSRWGYQITI